MSLVFRQPCLFCGIGEDPTAKTNCNQQQQQQQQPQQQL
jgi:hypothetical protein